jgi:hypothetical protein
VVIRPTQERVHRSNRERINAFESMGWCSCIGGLAFFLAKTSSGSFFAIHCFSKDEQLSCIPQEHEPDIIRLQEIQKKSDLYPKGVGVLLLVLGVMMFGSLFDFSEKEMILKSLLFKAAFTLPSVLMIFPFGHILIRSILKIKFNSKELLLSFLIAWAVPTFISFLIGEDAYNTIIFSAILFPACGFMLSVSCVRLLNN